MTPNYPIGKRFEGKHVLITAGAGSIGSATALRIAREGAARIVLVDQNNAINIVAEQLRASCQQVDARQLDVTDEDAVSDLCSSISISRWRGMVRSFRL